MLNGTQPAVAWQAASGPRAIASFCALTSPVNDCLALLWPQMPLTSQYQAPLPTANCPSTVAVP